MEIDTALADECLQILSPKGRLSTALPGYQARQAQISLSLAIARAIEGSECLVAEAGTGTGKTFAYLTPCILSGKKALISTATKTLQDQLFQKDLPMLLKALGRSARIQNLKGRANYICRYRVELYAKEGRFQGVEHIKDILTVKENLPRLVKGERSELPEIKEESGAWGYVTSTAENCLNAECPHHAACFFSSGEKACLRCRSCGHQSSSFFCRFAFKGRGFWRTFAGYGNRHL